MGHLTTLATCNLNQWALDFDGNQKRIVESVRQARAAGASLRVGPELEITEQVLKLLHRKAVKLVEEYYLPRIITKVTGQSKVPIGDAVISTLDTCVGCETCEELFRLYYDGSCMIVINGRVVAQGSQFSLQDVEVVTATVDLEEVRSYRTSRSRAMQAKDSTPYRRIEVGMSLSSNSEDVDPMVGPSKQIEFKYHLPEEEIALGPACFLWDYLRRSRQAGYFLPLSGGIDSCATAVIIHSMCRLVDQAIKKGDNPQVLADLLRIVGEEEDSKWRPQDPQEIAKRIFHTAYMGMKVNSSADTRARARDLGEAIGSYHLNFDIDTVVSAVIALCTAVTSFTPKYKMYGGTPVSNLALQNIQARLRMVLAYMFAQLLPTVRGRTKPGSLLVLGSANVDESLRGYLTKYDCSSADINPIGAISKTDLKRFILWASKGFDMPLLQSFIDAPPTAELEPITDDYTQSDEVDMGMSYNELSMYGRLRKVDKLGPYGMWRKLLHEWGHMLSPQEIYEKTRSFFWYYSINRHKMTTVTPAYHAEQYSPDDNRFDLRPFLYPSFDYAYRKIERTIKAMGVAGTKRPEFTEKDE
ncbi:glutamine-dependent NAD(+) synthetase [Xylographa trunciseda]|nr:glutamine-dependent NAD(+) synthetase [Xylographa trunciseda]